MANMNMQDLAGTTNTTTYVLFGRNVTVQPSDEVLPRLKADIAAAGVDSFSIVLNGEEVDEVGDMPAIFNGHSIEVRKSVKAGAEMSMGDLSGAASRTSYTLFGREITVLPTDEVLPRLKADIASQGVDSFSIILNGEEVDEVGDLPAVFNGHEIEVRKSVKAGICLG